MKKFLSITTALLIIISALFLNSCNNNNANKAKTEVTEATSAPAKNTSEELKAYLSKFTKGKDPLYGSWKIKGADIFTFIFRNDGYAQVAIGGEANFTKLILDKKKKTLSLSLPGTLDGTFNYSFSDNNKTLTLKTDNTTYEMKKQKDYSIVPKAPKNSTVDNNILGWWKSDGNIIYFFGSDGVMYSNTIVMETAYTYNIKNGKIYAVYEYSGKNKVDFKYKLNKKTLTIDGEKFKKYNP